MSGFETITTGRNVHLSNLSSAVRNFKYVGKSVATPVHSQRQAGAIIKEDQKSLFEAMEQLALARSTVGEISVITTEDLFDILSYALKAYVSETDIMAARLAGGDLAALRPKERQARKLGNMMELLEEILIANKIFNPANFGGQTAPASAKFDAGGADPVKIITEAKERIYGYESVPGAKIKVLFGRTAWIAYRNSAEVKKAFQGSVGGAMASETLSDFAQRYAASQLEVDEVLVGRARRKDGAGNLVDIWTDNVLVAVVHEGEEADSGAFCHTLWWGDTLRRVYEQFTHDNDQFADGAWLLKIASSFLPKILNVLGGYLITDCVT